MTDYRMLVQSMSDSIVSPPIKVRSVRGISSEIDVSTHITTAG